LYNKKKGKKLKAIFAAVTPNDPTYDQWWEFHGLRDDDWPDQEQETIKRLIEASHGEGSFAVIELPPFPKRPTDTTEQEVLSS
jgi:hypothetical protein